MTQRTKTPTETEADTVQPTKTWRVDIPRTTTQSLATKNKYIKNTLNIAYVFVCCIVLYKLGTVLYTKKITNDLMKKNAACPALLSVTRSARDTLIVMKAEPLCNEYVLENLK